MPIGTQNLIDSYNNELNDGLFYTFDQKEFETEKKDIIFLIMLLNK